MPGERDGIAVARGSVVARIAGIEPRRRLDEAPRDAREQRVQCQPPSAGILAAQGAEEVGDGAPERVYDAIDSGVLAMDAYVFS